MSTKPRSPTADEVFAARQASGLSQAKAASLIHATGRAWQYWEADKRDMPPALWELFQLKTSSVVANAPEAARLLRRTTMVLQRAAHVLAEIDDRTQPSSPDKIRLYTLRCEIVETIKEVAPEYYGIKEPAAAATCAIGGAVRVAGRMGACTQHGIGNSCHNIGTCQHKEMK